MCNCVSLCTHPALNSGWLIVTGTHTHVSSEVVKCSFPPAGQRNTALSDHGRWQSRIVGRRLAREAFSHIYSSDLARALEVWGSVCESGSHDCSVADDMKTTRRLHGMSPPLPAHRLLRSLQLSWKMRQR